MPRVLRLSSPSRVVLLALLVIAAIATKIRAEDRPAPICGDSFCWTPWSCELCSYMPNTTCRCTSPTECLVNAC